MFAVPGWNLSADMLKRQEEDVGGSSSKKRKRQQGNAALADDNVNSIPLNHAGKKAKTDPVISVDHSSSNDASELNSQKNAFRKFQETLDPEEGGKQKKKKKNKQKAKKDQPVADAENAPVENGDAASSLESPAPSKKSKKDKTATPTVPPAPQTLSAGAKLTPLQTAMRQKLMGARFRHLNETLYTAPSGASSTLFDQNPGFFEEYHSGFREQVGKWPENPVETFVRDLMERNKLRGPPKKERESQKEAEDAPAQDVHLKPLPRNGGTCKVADLGCGDAALAAKVREARTNVQVLSYDLAAPNKLVTKADIANLPLQDGSINIAIFCLALMGTNWIDFIEEAYRVLHWKGELWVAEIKSRFGKVGKGRVGHSVGFRQKNNKKPSKADSAKQHGAETEEDRRRLAEEVDEVPPAEGTDVSAFVDVLRKRGFALQDEKAIDMSNKMFVKMRFVKSLPALKGKNVQEGQKKEGVRRGKVFIEKEENEIDEKSVLKPCLYKIR